MNNSRIVLRSGLSPGSLIGMIGRPETSFFHPCFLFSLIFCFCINNGSFARFFVRYPDISSPPVRLYDEKHQKNIK